MNGADGKLDAWALSEAQKILVALGVTLNEAKTRIVQVSPGI